METCNVFLQQWYSSFHAVYLQSLFPESEANCSPTGSSGLSLLQPLQLCHTLLRIQNNRRKQCCVLATSQFRQPHLLLFGDLARARTSLSAAEAIAVGSYIAPFLKELILTLFPPLLKQRCSSMVNILLLWLLKPAKSHPFLRIFSLSAILHCNVCFSSYCLVISSVILTTCWEGFPWTASPWLVFILLTRSCAICQTPFSWQVPLSFPVVVIGKLCVLSSSTWSMVPFSCLIFLLQRM